MRPARPAWTGSDSRTPSTIPPVTVPASLNGRPEPTGEITVSPGGESSQAPLPGDPNQPPTGPPGSPPPGPPLGPAIGLLTVCRSTRVTLPGDGAVPDFDHERAEAAVRELLFAVGENPDREGLQATPGRVARAYAEMFGGLRMKAERCPHDDLRPRPRRAGPGQEHRGLVDV